MIVLYILLWILSIYIIDKIITKVLLDIKNREILHKNSLNNDFKIISLKNISKDLAIIMKKLWVEYKPNIINNVTNKSLIKKFNKYYFKNIDNLDKKSVKYQYYKTIKNMLKKELLYLAKSK